jgi:hypothetical protein
VPQCHLRLTRIDIRQPTPPRSILRWDAPRQVAVTARTAFAYMHRVSPPVATCRVRPFFRESPVGQVSIHSSYSVPRPFLRTHLPERMSANLPSVEILLWRI